MLVLYPALLQFVFSAVSTIFQGTFTNPPPEHRESLLLPYFMAANLPRGFLQDLVNFTLSEPETGILSPGSDVICQVSSGSLFTKVFMPLLQGLLIAISSTSLKVRASSQSYLIGSKLRFHFSA